MAVAFALGLDDARQNDPDCAGLPVVTCHRTQIPQCHRHVEPVAGRAGPGPSQPVQVDDGVGHARTRKQVADHLGDRGLASPHVPLISSALDEILGGRDTCRRYEPGQVSSEPRGAAVYLVLGAERLR